MIVGIFSDVHDHLVNLEKALNLFQEKEIRTLIFCGDFCSPIPVITIGKYNGTIHCVFGNGDGDRFTISKFALKEFPNIILHGEHAELEFEGVKIAVTHYPLYGNALASTGRYNAVFSGHTHEVFQEIIGNCLHVNPGEVMGAFGDATCGIYNTVSNTIEIFVLK
jgi:putative phosphoesterase